MAERPKDMLGAMQELLTTMAQIRDALILHGLVLGKDSEDAENASETLRFMARGHKLITVPD